MTATDDLRLLLDELRNLACDINEEEIRSHSVITLNQGQYNRQLRLDMNCDWLNAWHAEHERVLQAIDATLRNDGVERTNDGVAECGTCHMEYAVWDDGTYTWGCICSACGKRFEYETGEGWNYCSNCGAEVVE